MNFTPLPARSFAFLLQQALERILRLRAFLREIKNLSNPEDIRLVEFHEIHVNKALSTINDRLSDLDALFSNKIHVGKTQLSTIWAFNTYFLIVHFRLRLLVALPSIEPEVYVFLGDFFREPIIRPTVVYSSYHNYAELDLIEHFQGDIDVTDNLPGSATPDNGKVVLLLPYVARNDPLMWVNLLHEMGHAYAAKIKVWDLVKDVVGKPEAVAITRRWVIEYFADFLSLRLAGPAYLCGFINWILCQTPNQIISTKTHPSPVKRVRYMRRYLEDAKPVVQTNACSFLCEIFEDVVRICGLSGDDPSLATPLISEDAMVAKVAELGAEHASLFSEPFGSAHLSDVHLLTEICEKGLPVSSKHLKSESDIRTSLGGLLAKKTLTADELYLAAGSLEEVPNHASTIVNVGWENRVGKLLDVFATIFCDEKRSAEQKIAVYGADMENSDAKLQRSLEVARLHGLWRSGSGTQHVAK
jgi:hypothetical protein